MQDSPRKNVALYLFPCLLIGGVVSLWMIDRRPTSDDDGRRDELTGETQDPEGRLAAAETTERVSRTPAPGASASTVEAAAAEAGSSVEAVSERLDQRSVWLNSTEVLAEGMLRGEADTEELAAMVVELIESADEEVVLTEQPDGTLSCVFVNSPELGTATLTFDPNLRGLGELQVELSFVDPPGEWLPGDAVLSTMEFQADLDDEGAFQGFSALVQTSLAPGAGRPEPATSGAMLMLNAGGVDAEFRSIETRLNANGNRSYSFQPPVELDAEALAGPRLARLGALLARHRNY